MTDHGGEPGPGGPALWTDAELMLRVVGVGRESDRLVKVRRPFVLVGRGPDADVLIEDRTVSARHAYLHADPRGVYAVDLVTRSGTRIRGTDRPVGWLRPGDWIEIAGRRIELVRLRIDGVPVDPPPSDAQLLADTERPGLASVTLEPHRTDEPPWVLGSELVFLGWSAACGIQVKDPAVSRTHCALVRSAAGAFLVDLCGRQTWIEDQAVQGAAPLLDGDLLTLGSTQFTVRVQPTAQPAAGPLARLAEPADNLPVLSLPPLSPDVLPAESQGALVTWLLGAIQGGQVEVLRRQGEFQRGLGQVLRQFQEDTAALLSAQLDRIESIDRELAAIRAEIERRNDPSPPPPPNVEPLRIARPTPAGPEGKATTAWLLERVNQLETENRSAWKDLLGRLSQTRKAT